MIGALEVPVEVIALGVLHGLVQGLLAVGLVLVYRVSRILNLAHADIGVFAATLLGLAVTRWHVPYWGALIGALVVGAAVGAATEVVVVRRLQHVPRIMTIVATLGLAQVLALAAAAMVGREAAVGYPDPPGLPEVSVGVLTAGPSVAGMGVLAPVAGVALAAWLARSRTGLELRATAAGADLARIVGIPATRLSATAWGIAGALSTGTAVLMGAAPGFLGGSVTGLDLLLRGLAAAVLARMASLPVALAAGVGIGVFEQVAFWNLAGGVVDVVLLGAVLVALATMRQRAGGEKEPWVALEAWRPLPVSLASLRPVRTARAGGLLAAGALVVLTVTLVSNATAVRLTALVSSAVVALSVGLVTGLAGRLTLGQAGFAAVGAVASLQVVTATGNLLIGLAVAVVVGALVSVLLAVPAIRARGPLLAVATLAFAVAMQHWVLPQPWALGSGLTPEPVVVGAMRTDTGRAYLVLALAIGFVVLWAVRNLWTSGLGRRIAAVRDNPAAAAALGIRPDRTVLLAVALGGGVAGIGGALHAHSLAVVTASAFPVSASILAVAMAVVGGIGTAGGPVLGALLLLGVPLVVPLDAAGLTTLAAGWLLLVVYVPRGLAAPMAWVRDRVVQRLAVGAGSEMEEAAAGPARLVLDHARGAPTPARGGALEAHGLRRSFEGVRAVDGVDLQIAPGEVVGVVGPNGAGKSTVIGLLAGFESADAGRVLLNGRDVSSLSAPARAAAGIVRSFQDPRAFPTMTVMDTIRVGLEHERRTRVLPALVGAGSRERDVTKHASEVLNLLGLQTHAHMPVRELSTGMHRVLELACLVGLSPRVLLLDEPSAGLSTAEVPGLVQLLARLHEHLGVTLLVVEHGPQIVPALGGRVVAMRAGRIVGDVDALPAHL